MPQSLEAIRYTTIDNSQIHHYKEKSVFDICPLKDVCTWPPCVSTQHLFMLSLSPIACLDPRGSLGDGTSMQTYNAAHLENQVFPTSLVSSFCKSLALHSKACRPLRSLWHLTPCHSHALSCLFPAK